MANSVDPERTAPSVFNLNGNQSQQCLLSVSVFRILWKLYSRIRQV